MYKSYIAIYCSYIRKTISAYNKGSQVKTSVTDTPFFIPSITQPDS